MVDLDKLIELGTKPCSICKQNIVPSYSNKFKAGSCIKLVWECTNCPQDQHQQQPSWVSQRQIGKTRYYEGNVLTACGTLLVGQSIDRILRTCNVIGLKTISRSTFFEMQSEYLIPAINQKYLDETAKLIVGRLGSPSLVICGDGRFCSPGKECQFNTNIFTVCEITMNSEPLKQNEKQDITALTFQHTTTVF